MAFLEPFIAGGEAFAELLGGLGEAAEGAEGAVQAAEGTAAEAAEGVKVPEGGDNTEKLRQESEGEDREVAHGKHHKLVKHHDGLDKLKRVLQAFEAERVLVGIPSNKNDRRLQSGTDRKALNNATIGIIMEKGSPAAHIPARPWLKPGIQSAKSQVIAKYEQAAKSALRSNDMAGLTAAHRVVGHLTADAVKRYITTGHFAPLSPRTVAQRARQRGTGRRRSEMKYMALVAGGMAPAMAQNVAGIRPLINTGQMRNAVTYVIRKKGAPGTYRGTKTMRVI